MSKNRSRANWRKQKNNSVKKVPSPPAQLDNPTDVNNTPKEKGKKKMTIAAIIILVLTIAGYSNDVAGVKTLITNFFTPKEKRWFDDQHVQGILLPPEVVAGRDLILNTGSKQQLLLEQLRNPDGLDPDASKGMAPNGIIMPGGGPVMGLRLKLVENTLYVSTTFRDIDEKIVGKMEFNKWAFRSQFISNYHDGDNNLEVLDTYGNVLFNLRFEYPNNLIINGYFVSDKAVSVYRDNSSFGWQKVLPNYRQNFFEEIRLLKPRNKYSL